MEDIKTEAVQAHSEGRLVEAEHSYRILLEQSDDPDVAINLGALAEKPKEATKKVATHYHRCLERWPGHRNLILNAVTAGEKQGESQQRCTG